MYQVLLENECQFQQCAFQQEIYDGDLIESNSVAIYFLLVSCSFFQICVPNEYAL